MLADTAKMRGCVIHTIGMSVQTEAVMKKMPHHQSAFLDVGCDFVAVTAWMMTAYRRCQCGECSPGSDDGTVRVWQLADGTPVGEPLRGHRGPVNAVAVAALPDSTPVIISGNGKVLDGMVRPATRNPGAPRSFTQATVSSPRYSRNRVRGTGANAFPYDLHIVDTRPPSVRCVFEWLSPNMPVTLGVRGAIYDFRFRASSVRGLRRRGSDRRHLRVARPGHLAGH